MLTTRIAAPMITCLVAALSLPATATASPAATRAAASNARTQRVLLTLTPQNRNALRALAHNTMHRGSSRTAALAAALPSAQQRTDVAATARNLGLSVERVSRMAVLVSGPATRVRTLFGSARAVNPSSPMQQPLPTLPSALRGSVSVALGGDDNRPAFTHFALPDNTADGTDFRTAYGVTNTDPLTPPTAAEQQETIATVQLSGWHSNDLSRYAAFLRQQTGNAGWPAPKYTRMDDPLLPSCIATKNVNNTCPNIVGDDVEVDLDQEAIYAAAPYANQRAYTSGNDLLGLYDSLASIGDDASDPRVDRHIVAASVSWGFCETDLDKDRSSTQLYSSFEDVLSYALATGVTVFASSGDNGAYCDGVHKGVTYPASSPQVVSVGGTQYSSSVATDTPQGWREADFTPKSGGASGGGTSHVFPLPAFQQAGGLTGTNRVVPDISAMAGSPGFDVVTTSPSGTEPDCVPLSSGGCVMSVGGTSVASPVTAATYALQVAQHGYTWGVGNILPGLYAQPGNFTDVDDKCAAANSTCTGWNGIDVARTGYDEVTGLGTPKWSSLVSAALGGIPHLTVGAAFTRSTTVPVAVHTADWQNFDRFRVDVDASHTCTVANATATPPTSVSIDDFGEQGLADGVHDLTLVAFNSADTSDNPCHFADAFVFVDTTKPSPVAQLSAGSGAKDLTVHWGGGDSGGSGIESYRISVTSGGQRVFSTTSTHASTVRVAGKRGATYQMSVTATDFAGNVQSTTATLIDDGGMKLSGPWNRVFTSSDYAGSTARSGGSAAGASASLTGRSYQLYLLECPTCGKLAVFVNGQRVKTIDTYAAHVRHRVAMTVYSSRKDATRHLVVKVLGAHDAKSRGSFVYIDAVSAKG